MRFTIPQFIEREAKIVGPLNLQQTLYVAVAGGIIFVAYFLLAKKNLPLFILISVVAAIISVSLAFIKINGKSLPVFIKNLFFFSLSPKMFLWKRKQATIILKKEPEKKELEDISPLKTSGKSQLKNLSYKIDTKIK